MTSAHFTVMAKVNQKTEKPNKKKHMERGKAKEHRVENWVCWGTNGGTRRNAMNQKEQKQPETPGYGPKKKNIIQFIKKLRKSVTRW